jgi:hypothetical protein
VIYQKAPNQGPYPWEPWRSWGRFTRYAEIGDDLYAHRHVDLYENGHLLRYDRTHWVDDFGILAGVRYDEKKFKKWWGPAITIEPVEFEEVWQAAASSPIWPLQLSSARMSTMGQVPIWLTRRKNRP